MAVIITLAMVLLVASAVLAVTGTAARGGRRGKRTQEGGGDHDLAEAARLPVAHGRAWRYRDSPADDGITTSSPTLDLRLGRQRGPRRIDPLAGGRLADP